jgi:hypothetical protein
MELAHSENHVVTQAPAKRRWRLQFSLATLIWMTITAGALLLFGMSYRETLALREETKRLRDTVGILTITDSTKVHVIAGRTADDRDWRWRVFCPVKRQFAAYYKLDHIIGSPAKQKETKNARDVGEGSSNLPAPYDATECEGAYEGSRLLQAGETTLTAAIFKSQVGNWQFVLSLNGSSFGGDIPLQMQEMFDGGFYVSGCDYLEGMGGTAAFDPGGAHDLLRMRWSHGSHAFFLKVWIDEVRQDGAQKPKTQAGKTQP